MNQQSNSQQLKTLQIIHGALCTGVTLFLLVSFGVNKNPMHTDIQPKDMPLVYVAIALAGTMAFISNMMFQKKLLEVDKAAPVSSRMVQYQTASIIRFAPLEGAALFNVVVWLLTGNLIAAIIAVAMLILMISLRPTKSKVMADLQITYPDTLD